MDAIIMCAGRGTRLMPLTEDKPKTMVRIKDKPIIHWILEELLELDIIDKYYIITGYKEGTLKSYIRYNFGNLNIEYIHQKELTGTADAIYLTKDYINDDFIVLAGDTIFNKDDLRYLTVCSNSILVTERFEKLYEYGTLLMRGGTIKQIHEKSTNPISNFVNCSAYHFTKDIFRYIPMTKVDTRFGERIITNTINLMIEDGYKFRGVPIEYLHEISRPEDIDEVERKL